MTQLCIELHPLHNLAPAASSANGLHGELKEGTTGGAASHLFPPVKRSVQQAILVIVFITKVIQEFVRHNGGDNLNFPAPDSGFYRPKKHVRSHDRQENGGRDSGDGQVGGFYRPKKTRDIT